MKHAIDATDALIAFGAAIAREGLTLSTCGNASVRLDAERMLITASGAPLAALTPERLSIVALADGRHLAGPKPSMEQEIHRRAYRARDKVGAVVHCQSRAATALACLPEPPANLDFIPEIPAYVRAHAYARPFALPGTPELADAVSAAFEDPEVTVVQMVNHGQVVVGATWETAIRRATFFELACGIALASPAARPMPAEASATLRGYARDV